MPFEAAILTQLEEILAGGFFYHNQLDQFLLHAGISNSLIAHARKKAEERNKAKGSFNTAPKRYVVQELMSLIKAKGNEGDEIVATLLTQVTSPASEKTFDQTPSIANAIKIIREQYQHDKEKKLEKEAEQIRVRTELANTEAKNKEKAYVNRESKLCDLKNRLSDLIVMSETQQRGYSLEKFLSDLFEIEGLEPRGSFRIVGEQIDGSFNFQSRTHLLEAKWTKEKCAGAEFGAFIYKLDGKSADTRGLFISINGFTEDSIKSLNSKGSLKFICLDGSHLYRALEPSVGLSKILKYAWRVASESGVAYLPIGQMIF